MFDAVPAYYVTNRTLKSSQISAVLSVLRIHPVQCAVISSIDDAAMALQLSREVIRANSDEHAHFIALSVWRDTQRPSLVLGDAAVLDAVFPDGKREEIVHEC